jgi:hypothetical protein
LLFAGLFSFGFLLAKLAGAPYRWLLIAPKRSPGSLTDRRAIPTFLTSKKIQSVGGVVMVVECADPFETLFAFQRALELSSDWLGTTTGAEFL